MWPRIQRNPDGSLMYNWYDPRNLEFSLSEKLSDAMNLPRNAQGGSPGISGVLGQNTYQNTINNAVYDDAVRRAQQNGTLQTTTNNNLTTGRDPGTNPGTPGNNNDVDLARQAYEQRVNQIRNLFGQTKQRAADIRSEADRNLETILKAVGAFRDRSQNLFNTAGQQITENASEILGSNARTAREQEGTLRRQGRALGLGDSSKFLQQTGLAGRLAAQQGNTLATRGQERRANQNLLDERLDQAQTQENTANDRRQSVYDSARALENTGLDQFGDNLDAASNMFGQSLNNILNYQRQLAAIQPLQASSVTAYTPDFSNVQNAISEIIGQPIAQAGSGKGIAMDMGNPYNPTSIQELLRRNRGLYA